MLPAQTHGIFPSARTGYAARHRPSVFPLKLGPGHGKNKDFGRFAALPLAICRGTVNAAARVILTAQGRERRMVKMVK
jgi:hypothetical protein